VRINIASTSVLGVTGPIIKMACHSDYLSLAMSEVIIQITKEGWKFRGQLKAIARNHIMQYLSTDADFSTSITPDPEFGLLQHQPLKYCLSSAGCP
jgi:hypothetical protein